MSTAGNQEIEKKLARFIDNGSSEENPASIKAMGIEALPVLERQIMQDLPIERIERIESALKLVLLGLFERGVSGAVARELAEFQKRIGFVLKYKSYSIKAASPLGYSIFLQNAREGFSFQRHITHKTEVFHILERLPGGFVFLCEYDEWLDCYEKDSFNAWLGGRSDPRYDRFRFDAQPGDVFIIDKLNVVHTVVGCVLEEFATVSTDMVDRLHDQNEGRGIPGEFCREFAEKKLAETAPPETNRLVDIAGGEHVIENLQPAAMQGGRKTSAVCASIKLGWYDIDAGAKTEVAESGGDALSLYVTSGGGRIFICGRDEAEDADRTAVALDKGDLLMVAPGMRYSFANDGSEPLRISEHRLPYAIALAGE